MRLNPREAFLKARKAARSGQIPYDGDRFPVAFDRATQQRVEKLAVAWRVPRAEMLRYLVAAALPAAERLPVPVDEPKEAGHDSR